jgi:polar amino acid transport system substrate-binding protein
MQRSLLGAVRFLGVAVLALVASQIPLASDASADTLSKVKESKYIIMGTYNEPPHNWVEMAGGGYKGIDYELASTILGGIGVETIDQIPVDWAGLIPGLSAGRWDMVAVGQAITPARAEQVDFTKPIYSYGLALIVPPGNPKGIMGRGQFPGQKIGGILGSTTGDYVNAIPDAEFVAYKTHPEMVADLKAGRIDAILAGETTAAFAQAMHPEPVEFVLGWEGYADQLYMIGFSFRKNDRPMVDTFDAALTNMKADGSLAAILKKYGLTEANIVK